MNDLSPEEVEEAKREKRRQYQRAWLARQPKGKSTEYARRYWYKQFLDDLDAAEYARDEETKEMLRARGINV